MIFFEVSGLEIRLVVVDLDLLCLSFLLETVQSKFPYCSESPSLQWQLHTFPEGKVCQEVQPIRRLKWGTASLIVRAPVTPIVLPIVHHGFEKVMPEKYMFDRRPLVPLWGKNIDIVVGEPIEFDVPKLKEKAFSESRNSSHSGAKWPTLKPCGLDEPAQRHLYSTISEQIRTVMERLRNLGKTEALILGQRTQP